MNRPNAINRPVVLHVLHTLRPAGAENLVHQLVAAQREMFQFVVVALDEGGSLQDSFTRMEVPVHVLERQPGLDHRCASRLLSIARQYDASIIHAHQYSPFFYTALARLSGRLPGRVVFTEHGRHFPDVRRLPRRVVNRIVLHRMAERITAVGDFVKRALIDNEGMPAERIEVIRNGIDSTRFAMPEGFSRSEKRAALGVPMDAPVILHVAGFRPVKDHTTAVRALRHLHDAGCKAHLLFAGSGPTQPLIHGEAHGLGLSEYMHFLGNRSDIAELWHASDVGLLTSVSEGVSVAILEGMAAGKPFVATDVGGNSEVIDAPATGLLAPRGDAAGLAVHLERLLTEPAERHVMGRAAVHRVTTHFNQRNMHAAYLGIYDALLSAGSGREEARDVA